jgi:hypothetical protein
VVTIKGHLSNITYKRLISKLGHTFLAVSGVTATFLVLVSTNQPAHNRVHVGYFDRSGRLDIWTFGFLVVTQSSQTVGPFDEFVAAQRRRVNEGGQCVQIKRLPRQPGQSSRLVGFAAFVLGLRCCAQQLVLDPKHRTRPTVTHLPVLLTTFPRAVAYHCTRFTPKRLRRNRSSARPATAAKKITTNPLTPDVVVEWNTLVLHRPVHIANHMTTQQIACMAVDVVITSVIFTRIK